MRRITGANTAENETSQTGWEVVAEDDRLLGHSSRNGVIRLVAGSDCPQAGGTSPQAVVWAGQSSVHRPSDTESTLGMAIE